MKCTDYQKLVDNKIKYTEEQATICIDFLRSKSDEYSNKLSAGEYKNVTEVTQKLQNIMIMQKIYNKVKELFPNKFNVPTLETNDLANRLTDLKDKLLGISSISGLTAKESSQTNLKCGSSIHKKENDDKPVFLCQICSQPRCSVDMPLHMKEKHSTFLPDITYVEKLKCASKYHKKENDNKPVTKCKLCGEPRCSVDMVPHLLTRHEAELSQEEKEKLKTQLRPMLKTV